MIEESPATNTTATAPKSGNPTGPRAGSSSLGAVAKPAAPAATAAPVATAAAGGNSLKIKFKDQFTQFTVTP